MVIVKEVIVKEIIVEERTKEHEFIKAQCCAAANSLYILSMA